MKTKLQNLTLTLALLAIALLLPATARATTRTVTSLNDDGSAGTLRFLIAASGSGDTINFAVTGTITLTGGELGIGRNLILSGPGANVLAISGNNASRVFNVGAGTVTISNLAIINGSNVGAAGTSSSFPGNGQGGAIINSGNLALTGCAINNNSASGGGGGNSSSSGYAIGGAIYNSGTLSLNSCTLNNNAVVGGYATESTGAGGNANGGAIYNHGILALTNCTIAANYANGGGGSSAGLSFEGNGGSSAGGGIWNDQTTCTMVACTFMGNTATGGRGGSSNPSAGGNGGSAMGGGVFDSGGGNYRNIIIANDTVTGGAGGQGSPPGANGATSGPEVNGTITSRGHNLIGMTDGSTGWMGSDQTGTIAFPLNALLGPLQNNGGPTLTIAPQPASAAIDNGDDTIASYLPTDQRGRNRRFGAHVDIGAYELNPAPVVTNLNDSDNGSLRTAIYQAAPGDLITFATGLSGTIVLTSGELVINNSFSLTGPTAAGVTVSGNNASRVFHFTGGTNTLSNLTIANGNTTNSGGGIYAEVVTLVLNNCTISSNTATFEDVGGIVCYGNLFATNCTVSGNKGPETGGLFIDSTNCVLRNCTICSNSGSIYGGLSAFNPSGGKPAVGSCIIAGNSGSGGTPDVEGNFTSQGYNLIGVTDSSSSGFGVNHDQVGSAGAPINPLLGPLQNNGGPTFTHALLTGSPAIDKGYSFGLNTDQRGLVRPYDYSTVANAPGGDGSDIGAFELQPVSPLLLITHSSQQVVVSWSTSLAGWTLQTNANLATGVWGNYLGSVVNNSATIAPPKGNLFFRLKQ